MLDDSKSTDSHRIAHDVYVPLSYDIQEQTHGYEVIPDHFRCRVSDDLILWDL